MSITQVLKGQSGAGHMHHVRTRSCLFKFNHEMELTMSSLRSPDTSGAPPACQVVPADPNEWSNFNAPAQTSPVATNRAQNSLGDLFAEANKRAPSGLRLHPFRVAQGHQEVPTIPEFSQILSDYSLNRVIGIPGITSEIKEHFLLAAFPAEFDLSAAKKLIARIDARLKKSLEADELHLNYSRSLIIQRIKASACEDDRSQILNLSGIAIGASSIAVISKDVAVRLPVQSGGAFAGIFPLLSDSNDPIAVYSLNSSRAAKSPMQTLAAVMRCVATIHAPAFDVLGVLDFVTERNFPKAGESSAFWLKSLAEVELHHLRGASSSFVSNALTNLNTSVTQRSIAQKLRLP
jgi:hypothetical protein